MIRDLLERVSVPRGARVDREKSVIHDVKLLGERSLNRRVYPSTTREKSVRAFEGAKVFRDHPERSNPGRERSVSEQLGRVRNVRNTPSGLVGDLHINPHAEGAAALMWDAEHSPDSVGMSMNAEGVAAAQRHSDGSEVIESITKVRSVDVVCVPATASSLYESLNPRAKQAQAVADLLERLSDRPSNAQLAAQRDLYNRLK